MFNLDQAIADWRRQMLAAGIKTPIIGSICLFCGAKLGRSVVRMLALLMAVVCTAQILNFRMPGEWRVWCGVVTVFSLVSIWLLHAPRHPDLNPNTATK
jgi:hypothetical protein